MPDPRETPAEGEVVLAWIGSEIGPAMYGTVTIFGKSRTGWWFNCTREIDAPDAWVPLPLARRAREMEAALAKIRGYGCSAYVFDDQPPAACECPGCLAARALMLPPANPEEPE